MTIYMFEIQAKVQNECTMLVLHYQSAMIPVIELCMTANDLQHSAGGTRMQSCQVHRR